MLTLFFIFLILIGAILFYHIQARIGEEQKANRLQFVKQNPQFEMFFRNSSLYKEHWITSYPTININKLNKSIAGMTDSQKKSL